MSRICPECNAVNEESDNFCIKCGTRLKEINNRGKDGADQQGGPSSNIKMEYTYESPESDQSKAYMDQSQQYGNQPNKDNNELKRRGNKKVIGIAAAIVVVVIGIFAGSFLMTRSTYKEPVENLFDFLNNPTETGFKEMYDEDILDSFSEILGYDAEECAEITKENMISTFGSGYKFKAKVVEQKPYDIDEVEEIYREEFDLDIKVQDSKKLTVEISVFSYGETLTKEIEMFVLKIDGSWSFDEALTEKYGNLWDIT